MNRFGIFLIISFFLYLFLQVIFLKNAVLFHTAFCFLYIGFLFRIPVEFGRLWLIVISFLLGILVDIFYDSLGLHALASVLIGYVRNHWLTLLTPQGGYDSNSVPGLSYGFQWYLTFSVPLILVHHLILFYVEAGGFDYFWYTLVKVLASAAFTLIALLLIEFIFPRRRT
jgi:hypothetical protein